MPPKRLGERLAAREGWYEAPGRPGYLRYWDGQTWTSAFAELLPPNDGTSFSKATPDVGDDADSLSVNPTRTASSGVEGKPESLSSGDQTGSAREVFWSEVDDADGFSELLRIADWTGRTSRRAYWQLGALGVATWALAVLSGLALALVSAGLVSVSWISATIRRLRDAGYSPLLALLALVPLLWPIVLVLCSRPAASPLTAASGRRLVAPDTPPRIVSAFRSRSVGELELFCATCVQKGGVIDVSTWTEDPNDNRWQFLLFRPRAKFAAVACRDCLAVRALEGVGKRSLGRHLLPPAILDCLEVAESGLSKANAQGRLLNPHAERVIERLWEHHT